MSNEDNLCLREVRLKGAEQWTNEGPGLWFLFPRSGTGQCVSGALQLPLSSHEALIVNVGANVTVLATQTSELIFWHFRTALETFYPLITCREIPHLRAVAALLEAGKHYPIEGTPALQCFSLLKTVPSESNLEHRTLLLRVAATLLSAELRTHTAPPVAGSTAAQRILPVLGQLSAAEIANTSTDELAKRFGCSRRHLNRLFRAQFGLSIEALRLEVRLAKATALLRDPQAKVLTVATDAGFSHLGHFNYHFKRRFGSSPSQWRKTAFASQPSPLPFQVPPHLYTNGDSGSQAGSRV